MFYLYILFSKKDKGYYIGVTQNLDDRLQYHNSGKVTSTKPRRPFVISYTEIYQLKSEALKREYHLKHNYQARKEVLDKIKM